jgi:hypothetical protein
MVVAIEPDRAVRDGLARLRIRPTDRDPERAEAVRQLREQPRARREAADEPHALDHAAARGDLGLDGLDGGLDRGLEQVGHFLPGELELAGADPDRGVLVERGAEGDVLRLVRVPEEPLRGLVELARDVVERVRRAVPAVGEFAGEEGSGPTGDEYRAGEDAWGIGRQDMAICV